MDLHIITGASRGLGAALAEQSVAAGNRVISIARGGCPAGEGMVCDLSDPAAAEDLISGILARIDPGDYQALVLVNNAGIVEPIGSGYSAAEAVRLINLNLTGVIVLTTGFIAALAGVAKRKLVLNISSGAAVNAYAGWSLYCASKAGLESHARCVGVEQASEARPVDVVNISPGVIDTDMQVAIRSADPADFPMLERFQGFHASGALASPGSIAAKLLAGIARDRRFTGETLEIDDYAA